jgi:site-specific DNA recombinase
VNTLNASRKVYGYCRVSIGKQLDGVSLEAQESRIRAFALAKGWDLSEVLVERAKSGKNMKRPLVERLRREVREGRVEAVIVLKLDRISRSVRDLLDLLETFQKHGTSFVSVTESLDTSSSMGKFVLTLLGAVAELERATIGDRTALALKHIRSEGRVYGPVPWGWKSVSGKLVPIPREQEALTEALKMRRNGASWDAIGKFFQRVGVKPRRGKWWPASVRQVLMSRMTTERAA